MWMANVNDSDPTTQFTRQAKRTCHARITFIPFYNLLVLVVYIFIRTPH